CVKLEEVLIEYDSSVWSVHVSESIYQMHNGAGELVVYLIDFVCDKDVKEFCAEIKAEEA
ncbi:MAG: hypothetical protein IJ327_05575, partial [Lachnospiraceae bacterium]|nr:hypothetical protein [Lachnospiraceae bacterium]